MYYALSIDIGVTALGWALWSEARWLYLERPLRAGVVTADRKEGNWVQKMYSTHRKLFDDALQDIKFLRSVYIEYPQVWTSTRGLAASAKGDVGKLAYAAGYLMSECYARFHKKHESFTRLLVTPQQWKGSLPKPVVNARIKAAIGDKAADGTPFKSHAWDAIGIGLTAKGFPVKEMTQHGTC